jgi:hypothetical protein
MVLYLGTLGASELYLLDRYPLFFRDRRWMPWSTQLALHYLPDFWKQEAILGMASSLKEGAISIA